MHREGGFAILYQQAAQAIESPLLKLSAADRAAAQAALRSLMEQRVVEKAIEGAADQFRAVVSGNEASVAIDLRQLKRDVLGEAAVAGLSQAASARLESLLAQVPDSFTAVDQTWTVKTPIWVRRTVGNTPYLLFGTVGLIVLGLFATGGTKKGLGLTGLSALASGGVLYAAMGFLRGVIEAGGTQWLNLEGQLGMEPATAGQLAGSVAGLVSRTLDQIRLITGLTAAVGMVLVIVALAWRPAREPAGAHAAVTTAAPNTEGNAAPQPATTVRAAAGAEPAVVAYRRENLTAGQANGRNSD